MKRMRKIIEIDEERCNGCGQCVIACAEGALEIIDGKARLVSENYCDGLGACLGDCPQDAIRIIEREAEEFDPEAVEEYLKGKEARGQQDQPAPCACPSTQLQTFGASSCEQANVPRSQGPLRSALTHWPIQIHLVPPTAPFLRGADLLIAADCTTIAYPGFHQEFLPGKVVMMGCPKFDDVKSYYKKFVDIFETADIKSVTVLIMEVPCCSGLPMMLKKAMDATGRQIPMEVIVVGTRGDILKRTQSAA